MKCFLILLVVSFSSSIAFGAPNAFEIKDLRALPHGFYGKGKFIVSPEEGLDRMFEGQVYDDGKVYGTQYLSGCSTSMKDYFAGNFIESF